MSYSSIIFFIILFGLIIYCYFYYETFLKYFPIHNIINFFVIIIAISGFFFPNIIKMFREGEDTENIKKYIIEKYKKK
jgi:hypothetical protein